MPTSPPAESTATADLHHVSSSQPACATRTFQATHLADILCAARNHCGLSLSAAARLAGIHKSVLSRIERGTIAAPRFDLLAKLAFIYDLSLDAIAASCGLPRLSITLIPPANLEISDPRLRSAFLTLAQSQDPNWVERTIAVIAAATAT